MNHIIHLKKTQLIPAPVRHPIFEVEIPTESLEILAKRCVENPTKENKDLVVLRCLPLLRYIVGRFLYHWPLTASFSDDIVGEGALALCRAVNNLSERNLDNLASYFMGTTRKAIEYYMNSVRSIAAPTLKLNYLKRQELGEPVYFNPVTNNTTNIAGSNFDLELIEAFEVVEKLALTQEEREYFESIFNGNKCDKGKKKLQARFEKFLRSFIDA